MFDLFESARDLHLRQFAKFINQLANEGIEGAAEVKLELGPDSTCHERFYCADFVTGDDARQIREMKPSEVLNVSGTTGWVAGLNLSFSEIVWDDVAIRHDGGEIGNDLIEPWFVRWCDPDHVRPEPDGPFASAAHALILASGEIWVDLGTAPAGALTELLELLSQAGAGHAHFDASRRY